MMTYQHSFYLCFKKKQRGWGQLSVRVTERQPSLEGGEVAIKVTAALPEVLFQRPLLTAKISVPEDKCSPATIDATVAENITDIVRQQLGIDMKLVIEQAQPPAPDDAETEAA
jgi:hypothetical protein